MAQARKKANGKVKKENVLMQKVHTMASAIVSRAQLANQAGLSFKGNRDLYEQLGYDRVLDFNKFTDRYARGGIASRIIEAFPTATWRNPPLVSVRGNEEFNKAWIGLEERLSIFHYLERTDRLAGVGRYSVLFLGLRGGRGFDQPTQKVKGPEDLLYLSPFSEGHAEIRTLEGSVTNPRFGLPSIYDVQFLANTTTDSRTFKKQVHASRVIHVAEGLLEDDIFGVPRLQRVWNYLDDLDKVVGGSAEAVWRTVDRGIQFDLDKELELHPDDEEDFEDQIEKYMLGISRTLKTKGITAKVLGSEMPDPRGPANTVIGLISGTTGIPQRILLGSERGELSSGQDERNFNARVLERQKSFAEPIILRPFIDRLITIGALPTPGERFNVEWPDLSTQTRKEKADIAARIGQAVRNVAEQGRTGVFVIPPKLFATEFLGIDAVDFDKAMKEEEKAISEAKDKEGTPPNADPEPSEG